MTAARIGLAHGVYTNPSAAPTSKPERKPLPAERGPSAAIRDSGASMRAVRLGHSSATPNASSTTIARTRSGSLPRPTPSTTFATPTIVTVNVIESPSTMPRGLRRPPTPPAESSAGSTGRTHGDSAVPAPASTAKPSRINIYRESRQPRTARDYDLITSERAPRHTRADSRARQLDLRRPAAPHSHRLARAAARFEEAAAPRRSTRPGGVQRRSNT